MILLLKIVSKGVLIKQYTVCILPYTEDGVTDWVVHTVCVKLNTCKKLKRDTVIISFDKENEIDGVRDRLREIDADFELDYLRGVLENISEFIYRELITIR